MEICIIISDDVFSRPKALFRLLMKKGNDVCLVAEVRDGRENRKKGETSIAAAAVGALSILHLKLTVLVVKALARVLPPFPWSCLTNREVCAFFWVSWVRIKNVNDPDFVWCLSSMRPDVVVSMQRQIFGTNILAVPKIACINCHPSKLPKYREFWLILLAMINGDEPIGVTVYTMTKKIDMGAKFAREAFGSGCRPYVHHELLLFSLANKIREFLQRVAGAW